MAARFGGRLYVASFTKTAVLGIDPDDVAGPPLATSATYTCDAISLGYGDRYADGQAIAKADYKVVILRGTVLDEDGDPSDALPGPGDAISCPPPGGGAALSSTVVEVRPVTEAFATAHVAGKGA